MAVFRRVDVQRAGPAALGVLVPPGARTPVILRPRSWAWDLLPARWQGASGAAPVFASFSRDEAAGVARRLVQQLEDAVTTRHSPVQLVVPPGPGDPSPPLSTGLLGDVSAAPRPSQIWIRAGEFVWVACARSPGAAYQPQLFTSQDDARRAGELLEAIVWPAADGAQEIYFNTQLFST